MRTRTKVMGLLLLIVTSASLALLACRPTEPKFNGRPLSFWIAQYQVEWLDGRTNHDAGDAIRAIGTNAIPFLLDWGTYKTPTWILHLYGHIPSRAWLMVFELLKVRHRVERSEAAVFAFSAFQTNADTVIPHLTHLMKDHRIAIHALARLGPEGLTQLLRAWSNSTDQDERWEIETGVVENLAPDQRNTNLVPPLITAMHQESLPADMSNALFQIVTKIATNTPPQ